MCLNNGVEPSPERLREFVSLMDAKGSKASTITNIAVNLPAGLVAFVMKLALKKNRR